MEYILEQFETPITNDVFQLYGEDLRCLDSGKPMLTAFHYDADINYTIELCKKNINKKFAVPLIRNCDHIP